MQKCGYCGRENQDDARNCAECGTELTGETEIRDGESLLAQPLAERRRVLESLGPLPVALRLSRITQAESVEEIEGAFNTHEGFSRPCWTVILKAMRHYHTPEARLAVWTDVVSQWASRWEDELGNDYWTTSSGACFLVSAFDGETAERLLQKAIWLAEKIRSVLGALAWEDRPHILLVHVADELLARRFDQAVAASDSGRTDRSGAGSQTQRAR